MKIITIHEILERCGGRKAVKDAMNLGTRAIATWVEDGCPPPIRWPVLVRLGDVTYEELDRLWKSTIGAPVLKTLEGNLEQKTGTGRSRR